MSGMRFFRIVTNNLKTTNGVPYINKTDLDNSSLIHWSAATAPEVFTGTRYYVFDQAIASIEVTAGVIYKAVGDGSAVTYTAITRLPGTFGTAAAANTTASGGTSEAEGKVPTLNANGKLDNSFIPSIAINEFLGSYASWAAAEAGVTHTPENGDTILIGATQETPGYVNVYLDGSSTATPYYLRSGTGNTRVWSDEEELNYLYLFNDGTESGVWGISAEVGADPIYRKLSGSQDDPWGGTWNLDTSVEFGSDPIPGSNGSLYICVDATQATFADKFVLLKNEEGNLSTDSFIEGDGIILTKSTTGNPTVTIAAKVDQTANSIVVDPTSKGLKVNLTAGAVKEVFDTKADKTSVFIVTSTDPATLADGKYFYTVDKKFYEVSSGTKTQYVVDIPVASAVTLGGVKEGNYISIANDGTISVNLATASTPGAVKPDGTTTEVDSNGALTVKTATASAKGIVKPDGTTIEVDGNGVLTVPTATSSVKGIVKPDNDTITVDANGVLSSAGGKWTQINVTASDFNSSDQYTITGFNEIICIDANGYEFMPSDIIRSTTNSGSTIIDMTGATTAEKTFTIYARSINFSAAPAPSAGTLLVSGAGSSEVNGEYTLTQGTIGTTSAVYTNSSNCTIKYSSDNSAWYLEDSTENSYYYKSGESVEGLWEMGNMGTAPTPTVSLT